jgi:hypothetical protein
MIKRFASTFLSYLLLSAVTFAATQEPPQDWREFRARHPYHTNVIALGPAAADGSRVLIVAEPAPHVTVAGLTALRQSALSNVGTEKWQIGWDGWVKDVVITLPRLSDEDLNNTLAAVEQYVYGSTYEAAVIRMPEPPAKPELQAPNLRVSAAELRSWAGSDALKFSTMFGETPRRLSALLSGGAHGVYYSAPEGLVAWIFPRKGALAQDSDIRQFAVDSDLIVGAMAGTNRVAVLARRRQVPQSDLPPLRSETIKLLASVDNDSLAQSYQRTYLFAGKYDDEHDWAPAYLSDELIDTEYGSLLNIADQLLKSWSENGMVTYEHFPYPSPHKFPFNGKPLSDLVELGAQGLTFNWNTRGAGYTVRQGDISVFAVNRTGSLPVSYFTAEDSPTARYEKEAYDWFSSQNDPNLIRVVQYASLYQIFRAFRTPAQTTFPRRQPDVTPLVQHLQQTLDRQDQLAKIVVEQLPAATKQAEGLRDSVATLKKTCGQSSVQRLATFLASPDTSAFKSVAAVAKKPESQWTDAEQCLMGSALVARLFLRDRQLKHLLVAETGWDLEDWKATYEKAASRPEGAGWIHTPTIVVSHPDEEHGQLTGGHNLDSAISYFRAGEVPAGEVRVVEEAGHKVIIVNKDDLPKLSSSSVLRASGSDVKTSELRSLVATELKAAHAAPVRPMEQALQHTSAAVERAVQVEEQHSIPLGWRVKRGEGMTVDRSASPSRVTVQLHKHSASQYELRFPNASSSTVDINGMASIQDAVSHAVRNMFPEATEIRVVATNFEPREAGNVLESTRIALKGEGVNSREVKILEERGGPGEDVLVRIAREGDAAKAECQWALHEATDASGARGYQAEFTVEVPSRSAGRSFWVRVKAFFLGERPLTTTLNALSERIKAIFLSPAMDLTYERASARVAAAIKQDAPQAKVNMELFDLLISLRQPLQGDREWEWAQLDLPTAHSSSASR